MENEHARGATALSAYGLLALATVVFDIDSGQRLDALYPPTAALEEDAKRSIAHLALPHSNRQDEGDTQFIVRFRAAAHESTFLFGFVLFRQERDGSRTRGYNQRALVLVATRPFVDLYERVLRVAGPLFFQSGNAVLEAVYENVMSWPEPIFGEPLSLTLAGTYVTCIIPKLLDYSHFDVATIASPESPSPRGHFIADLDENVDEDVDEDGNGDEENSCIDGNGRGDSALDSGDDEKCVLVKEGRFVVTTQESPPSPSFGDVLLSKRNHLPTEFESIGLYSSFMGLESSLWYLWQLAITGESLVILSPHARTCSQATLAFTSFIAPLRFEGDYRPYYALYEADFDEIAQRHTNGTWNPENTSIIGTTNPFFMKSFKRWPNALVFPFLDTPPKESNRKRIGVGLLQEDAAGNDGVSIRLKSNADLDLLEDSHRAMLLRRRARYINPDAAILNQLVAPPEVRVTQTACDHENAHVTINNAILRRHFQKLTMRFLRPFEAYFGLWKTHGINSNLYMSADEVLKPFDVKEFIESVNPRTLPHQIKRTKWRMLYMAFIKSPHFTPWFNYRRKRCICEFTETLRGLRSIVTPQMLLSTPAGGDLSLEQCIALQGEIEAALNQELATFSRDQNDQLDTILLHLDAVKQRISAYLSNDR